MRIDYSKDLVKPDFTLFKYLKKSKFCLIPIITYVKKISSMKEWRKLINVVYVDGKTILHKAIEINLNDLVYFLIWNGADIWLWDSK